MDWTADAIRYMCMNLFAVKNGKDDKLDDFRILEVKSNNIIKEMERRKQTQEGLGEELKNIYQEREYLWNNIKQQKEQDEVFVEELIKEDDYDETYMKTMMRMKLPKK